MPWSIFSNGGGPGAALTWSIDLLKKLGAPLTPGNEQFVFDWEVSEGGGGAFNPLNQGTDPGAPQLTSSGNQYGGGAADYVSWSAGLQGAADYLAMPAFQAIADNLRANQPEAARAALISSPWAASHYGGGSAFSGEGIPGKASVLAPGGGAVNGSTDAGTPTSIPGALGSLTTDLKTAVIVVPVVAGGAALVVWGFARMTGAKSKVETAAKVAGTGALL